MELSVFDLSKYLGVLPDTIERWVRQGKLPVSRQGGSYRFQIDALEKWAAKHNICLTLSNSRPVEKQEEPQVLLSTAVQTGGVYFNIPGNSVNEVLTASIEKISEIPDDFKTDLLDRLLEREHALSTGIGNGIAIPHPREQLRYLSHPLVSICFLAHPVPYNALDQKPVSILFFILCPSLKLHLQLLSSLSFCLRNPLFIDFLRTQPGVDRLVDQINRIQDANPI